ncbi:peptidylprolyl isomerase [bacterium SCSIO 12741]|nr:peptidylprolyl isomerase [bacterium SCSIO 12741]
MNRTIALLLGLIMSTGLLAQEDVLLNIAGEDITLDEFLMVYNKNNSNAQSIDPKTKEEYLDLYINFRLKVRQAEDMGMDTNRNFNKELSGYRRQLAVPYLNDETVTEELIQEAYNRMKEDVNAYHILIRCEPDASPQDSLEAWRKCMLIKRKITDPATDFEKLAKVESEDPSAVNNGGNLGYFNVFQMVYPFESAAYNTEVGQVSDPVRSRFGYHLVWVKDRRPARGEIQVAHIMVQTSENDDEKAAEEKEKKAMEIYDELQKGANFEELAKKYSDDRGTANKGENFLGLEPVEWCLSLKKQPLAWRITEIFQLR